MSAKRIIVVGGGKAGAAMSRGVEAALAGRLDRVIGVVNVPDSLVEPLKAIRLHPGRPTGSNHPTLEGVAGSRMMHDLVVNPRPNDVYLCLLSGGGSALLPAPVSGLTLGVKQEVTKLLHACGATINEMNCVRKHLSRIKGGRLAQAFRGEAMFSLIISDVVGDQLDVIASGPTAPDPTTFADALAVLGKYGLTDRVPADALKHLQMGAQGTIAETPKTLPDNITNLILGNNVRSLKSAAAAAEGLGYRVLNLGSYIEGETIPVAVAMAGVVRSIKEQGIPLSPPVCVLSGGETTVTLPDQHGLGGRNQEFVLAAALKLGAEGLRNVVVLSGGTDGEDGPTDAAGAWADTVTAEAADYLARHDAYHYFEKTGGLIKTGLTHTNVMDVRVILIL
jgi:hydroxypyruvate reductase/glycerate 2-kinase